MFLGVALFLNACTVVPAAPPRPALPLPEEIAKRFEHPILPASIDFFREKRYERYTRRWGEFRGIDGLSVPFEYYIPHGAKDAPFGLVLPYLDGSYLLPRLICRNLAQHGVVAAFLERPGEVLSPRQRGADLEQMARETVSRYRAFIDWVSERSEVDHQKIGVVGVSMGGMLGTILQAVDPRIAKSVLILPGCNVPEILLRSQEEKVLDYLSFRRLRESLTPEEIAEEFREQFLSDPAELAPYVDSRGVLMISARYDTVIPRESSDMLWSLLGKPTRVWLPTGHYTAGLCLPYLEHKIVQHFSSPWESLKLSAPEPELRTASHAAP